MNKPRLARKTNNNANQLEYRFIADSLTSIAKQQNNENHQSNNTKLAMTVLEASNLFERTSGRFGLDTIINLTTPQWDTILNHFEVTESLFSTLSKTIKKQNIGLRNKSKNNTPIIVCHLIENVLLNNTTNKNLQIITACALALGLKNRPEILRCSLANFAQWPSHSNNPQIKTICEQYCAATQINPDDMTLSGLFMSFINSAHKNHKKGFYPHCSIINVCLTTFGKLSSNINLPHQFRTQAYEWCAQYLNEFDCFCSPEQSQSLTTSNNDYDREIIQKTHEVMISLNHKKAQENFFNVLFTPLNPSFNPRQNKLKAHNAYYRKIGAAEKLAHVSGQNKIAFQRRLDQDNNEWGRDLEKQLRADPIYRLDTLKEAQSALENEGNTSIQNLVSQYDPEGILQRNLAFMHCLRYLYANRSTFDPCNIRLYENHITLKESFLKRQDKFIGPLNIKGLLSINLETRLYEEEAIAFDNWIQNVRQYNPDFFYTLKSKIENLTPSDLTLTFEIFFIEANEVETFQYYLDPIEGPASLFHFVGKIRCWTSGYHGRLLTRMQCFFDQDEIRARLNSEPGYIFNPDEYLHHYEHTVGAQRFYNSENGILPFLEEAVSPSNNPRYQFSEKEAQMICKYFSETGFAAYLPHWLIFIIDHQFLDDQQQIENFFPLIQAFEALSTTKFPRNLMQKLFRQKGYLIPPYDSRIAKTQKERQRHIYQSAKRCLLKLPVSTPQYSHYSNNDTHPVRPSIVAAKKHPVPFTPYNLNNLIDEFQSHEAKPGQYFKYRQLSKKLLQTEHPKAIKAIMDEVMRYKDVHYPPNAPLRPLFKGLIGMLVSTESFESAIHSIAVDDAKTKSGVFAQTNFSAVLIRWAQKNRIDLNKILGQSFADYEAPEEIRILQSEIDLFTDQIRDLESDIMIKYDHEKTLKEQQKALSVEFIKTIEDLDTKIGQLNNQNTRVTDAFKDLLISSADLASNTESRSYDSNSLYINTTRTQQSQFITIVKEHIAEIEGLIEPTHNNKESLDLFNDLIILKEILITSEDLHAKLSDLASNNLSLIENKQAISRQETELFGHDNRRPGLVLQKQRKERERNLKIASLVDNPSTYPEQAVIQMVTYTYNAIRKQYFKEVLISAGESSVKTIEAYLENELIPLRDKLSKNQGIYLEHEAQEMLAKTNERIDFLLSVLSQIEGLDKAS